MVTCKKNKIDSSVVGLAVAVENCAGVLPDNKADTSSFAAASLTAEVTAIDASYNSQYKEITIRATVDPVSGPTIRMRINRDRSAAITNNVGVSEFVGGDNRWQVVYDGTAIAGRWDELETTTTDSVLVSIISLEGFVEDGDDFEIEISDDNFVTSATQVLTVTSDGTGLVTWNQIELNEFGDFGGEVTTTNRGTISESRQRQKGNIVDLEAKAGYTTDITNSTFDLFIEGFLFAASHTKGSYMETLNANETSLTITGVTVKIETTTTDLTTLELNVGEWIYVGGDTAASRFTQGSGFARIRAIATNALTIDRIGWSGIMAEAADPGKSIELYFGIFTRNEKDPTLIIAKSYQFEQTLGQDQIGVQSQYMTGQHASDLTINFPSAETLTADFAFIGLDSEQRDGAEGLKAGSRVTATTEDAYNSADHIREMIVYVHDDTKIKPGSVFGFVESGTVTVNNNATPAKRIGRLGGFDVNVGTLEVGGEITAYFTSVEALKAIRNNSDVGFNVIGAFNNKGFVVDIPLLTLSGGTPQISENDPVKLSLDKQAAENSDGYTISFTKFETLPDVAMAEVS